MCVRVISKMVVTCPEGEQFKKQFGFRRSIRYISHIFVLKPPQGEYYIVEELL